MKAGKDKQNDDHRNVSFSVEIIWKSYQKKNEACSWKKGVQEYYDGCRKVAMNFRGPTYILADNVMNSFEIYLTKLIYLSNSNSTLLTSSTTAILQSLSKLNKLKKSALDVIKEANEVVLKLVEEFNDITSKLSNTIGELADSFNDALNDLGCSLSTFLNEFLRSGITGYIKKVDYEPVLRQCQKLLNTVALIAETLLNECGFATHDVYEAVTVLSLICVYFVLVVQGMNSCFQNVLYEQKLTISQNIESCSMSMDYIVLEATQSLASVTYPFNQSIKGLLTKIVNITIFINTMFKNVLGLFEGVPISVGQITQNLLKDVTTTNAKNGHTNILKGVGIN